MLQWYFLELNQALLRYYSNILLMHITPQLCKMWIRFNVRL